jgi:hypothetical protein
MVIVTRSICRLPEPRTSLRWQLRDHNNHYLEHTMEQTSQPLSQEHETQREVIFGRSALFYFKTDDHVI